MTVARAPLAAGRPPAAALPVPSTPSARSARDLGPPAGRSLQRWALTAAAAGWPVFPLWPWTKQPAVRDWERRATCDPHQIRWWWTQQAWNIGIAAGPAGLLVLDLDVADLAVVVPPPQWPTATSGRDVLLALAAACGEPPPTATFTVATPSGRHLYFRQPPGVALRNTQGQAGGGLGWCIDTRGHGGFVVAAGSRRRNGHYRILRSHAPIVLPAWITAALTPPALPPSPPPPARPIPVDRLDAYVAAVVAGETAAVRAAVPGQRHWVLLRAARRLGHWVGGGALHEHFAVAELAAAAAHYVNPRKTARTIHDGLAYGARCPRTDIPELQDH